MTILEEAAKLVDGDRQDKYGHPADDFTKVTSAAKALGVDPLSGPLHHALYMVLVKISRLVETPDHHDSIVDGAGYFRTYEKVLERIETKPAFGAGVRVRLTKPWGDAVRGEEGRVVGPDTFYDWIVAFDNHPGNRHYCPEDTLEIVNPSTVKRTTSNGCQLLENGDWIHVPGCVYPG